MPRMEPRHSLTRAREAAGLTQRQLADQVGLGSRVRVSQYETGLKAPSVDVALRIAAALDTSVEDAFRRDTPGTRAGRVESEETNPNSRSENIR